MEVKIDQNRAAVLMGAALAGATLRLGDSPRKKGEIISVFAAVAASSAVVSHIDGDKKVDAVMDALMASVTVFVGAGAVKAAREGASLQEGLALAGITALAVASAIE